MVRKTLIINGITRNILVDETETLATFLSERLLLTGCKIGCGEGHCGDGEPDQRGLRARRGLRHQSRRL